MFGWEFPPHISGGLGTACRGLTKALASFDDVEVTFVVPKIWGDEDGANITLLGADKVPVIHEQILFDDIPAKVDYYELKSGLIPYLGTNEFYELKSVIPEEVNRLVETTAEGNIMFNGDYGSSLFQEIEAFATVAEILAGELDFDVIHVHDWMTFPAGMAAKRISGKPLVVHVHSTEFDRSGTQVNPFIFNTERQGMQLADKIITVSNFTRKMITRNYYIEPEKVLTVFNAVEHLVPGQVSSGIEKGDQKTVLFLGRITGQKGPEYFVEAACLVLQKMPEVRFVMAGKGDLRNRMIDRAAELNISDQFEFPGFIADEDVFGRLQSCNVFMMPSVSEPFGIVALEAMQAGVPVIISKQSGASEILKNVIKIDYWNVYEMAEVILQLLTDQRLADQLGLDGRHEAENLNWTDSAAQIRKLYLELR
jgi:glycosyltransferase involved in cell wall biosynthesis